MFITALTVRTSTLSSTAKAIEPVGILLGANMDKIKQDVKLLLGKYGSVAILAAMADIFTDNSAYRPTHFRPGVFKRQAKLFQQTADKTAKICGMTVADVYHNSYRQL